MRGGKTMRLVQLLREELERSPSVKVALTGMSREAALRAMKGCSPDQLARVIVDGKPLALIN